MVSDASDDSRRRSTDIGGARGSLNALRTMTRYGAGTTRSMKWSWAVSFVVGQRLDADEVDIPAASERTRERDGSSELDAFVNQQIAAIMVRAPRPRHCCSSCTS